MFIHQGLALVHPSRINPVGYTGPMNGNQPQKPPITPTPTEGDDNAQTRASPSSSSRRGHNLRSIPREVRARYLGQEPLGEGEASEPLQVRAPREVLEAFKGLSPRERGEVVGIGLRVREAWGEEAPSPEEVEEALGFLGRIPGWVWAVLRLIWGRRG